MITKSYIEKCIKYKKAIDSLLSVIKPLMGFEIGDYFHCPTLTDPEDSEQVKEIISSKYIYAKDPMERYPIGECILLPAEKELMDAADKQGIYIDNCTPGMGAEALLDKMIALPDFKKRFL